MITKYTEFNIICDICEIDGNNCMIYDWMPDDKRTQEIWSKGTMGGSGMSVMEMRRLAKSYGWVRKNGKDICPRCWDKIEKG